MAQIAGQQDWKTEYRQLLAEFESREQGWSAREALLCNTASRLAIAASGHDPRLDPHLEAIRTLVKTGENEQRLTRHLDALSEAVTAHELSGSPALDLSAFVARLPLPPAQQKRFIDRVDAAPPPAQTRALLDLAGELRTLIDAPAAVQDDETAAWSALRSLTARFAELGPLTIPAHALSERLGEAGESGEPLETVLQELAELVARGLQDLQAENDALQQFLEQVTRQLDEFERWTARQEQDTVEQRASGDALGAGVEEQVHGLHRELAASADLGDLRSRVQSRLDTIGEHLRDFQEREMQRLAQSERRNALLRQEVNQLRVRTTELARLCGDQQSRLMLDTLTGVYTRYAYENRLQEEFQRWQRHGQPLSFAIWDIDFFKRVNDNYGHQTGDRLLKIVATLLARNTRTEDFVARIGGEEFVILFPATPLTDAYRLAERLRERIAGTRFAHHGQPLEVTVSGGVTAFRDGDTPETVYERADKALYSAKNAGRNRCVADGLDDTTRHQA